MGMGYNKLIEEWKAKQNALREKLRFVIAALSDNDKKFTMMAYFGMKQRSMMLQGVGMNNSAQLKIQLIKRLTNKGYNMQVLGINCIREFLRDARIEEENARLEAERQMKEKERILRRIMNANVRFMGIGFRQALQWTVADREAEIKKAMKLRGICNRMVDTNTRLMGMGYNKLVEEWKERMRMIKEKLKFVIKSLTDKDARYALQAYNALRERQQLLNGVGVGNAGMMKIQLIKRLTNAGVNLQVMGVNCIRDFLKSEREVEGKAKEENERLRKEQEKICKRLLNKNLNLMALANRELKVHCEALVNAERLRAMKQRGIMRRIIDANARFMGMAMNQLKSHSKELQLESEAKSNVTNMRDALLDKLFGNREKFERQMFVAAAEKLIKWNHLCNTKQAIIKNMFRKLLGKNDQVLLCAYRNLIENNVQKKTFEKCAALFRALETSDRCIDNTYRIYYRLLVTFKHVNPWMTRVVNAITKNAKVDPQIAFWRLKDMRTKGTALNANRIVKMRKMFEICNKHYIMQVARSFWKIDRCLDMDQTMNSSFYYAQRMGQQQGSSDMYSGMGSNQMQSRVDLQSRGDPSQMAGNDGKNTFMSPDRQATVVRGTSPRGKYESQGPVKNDKNSMSRGLLGVMRKK